MAAGEDMETENPAGDIEIVDVEKDAKRLVNFFLNNPFN